MAKFMLVSENEALTAATVKTMLQYVAPSGTQARVRAWHISLDGVTAANVPGDIELLIQTTAGTATSLTMVDWQGQGLTARGSAQRTFTAEPTASSVLWALQLTPNGGAYGEWPGDEGPTLAASSRVGLRANFANNVNATVWMLIEEL